MTPTRLFEFIEIQKSQNPIDKCISTKYNRTWQNLSTKAFYNKIQEVSQSLLNIGVKKGDKIALISSNNRTEWCIVDLAILQLGAVTVPIYPTITALEYQYILEHSESKYCFVSDLEILDKLNSVRENLYKLKEIYSFDSIKYCRHWSELLNGINIETQNLVNTAKANVTPQNLASIIYTSGTTGVPKGVMLSHENIVSNVLATSKRFPVGFENNSYSLSFLPLCHIYERMIIYLYYYKSIGIHFAESLDTISENLKEVKPVIITTVPRLLEKVYDKIYAKGLELSVIKKKLFYWALNLGLRYEPYGKNGFLYELKLKIARKLIFSKWKKALGGKLHTISSASVALQPKLARVFTAAGIIIIEGYGLTETSPVISVNEYRNKGLKFGTTGKPIEKVEVKIAKDGEILCKGPNIMLGYYKDPSMTAEAINNGYFHTGDIGVIDSDGFLSITGRKKELFKTSGGKYIAPQVIENQIKQSLFIEQIMVIGEGEKMPAALIQPAFEYIEKWIKTQNLNLEITPSNICSCSEVIIAIQKDIDLHNANFSKWQRIKRFELTPEVWSIDQGHLTPTMKVKRKAVEQRYKTLYNKIYPKNIT